MLHLVKHLLKPKAIFKTNMRNIAQQGDNEDLNDLLEKDEKMKSRAWFPGVVKTNNKAYAEIPTSSLVGPHTTDALLWCEKRQ